MSTMVGSIAKIRELREARFKLVKDAQAMFDKKDVTKEDRDKFDKMMADADALKADIDRLERSHTSELELANTGAPPREKVNTDPTSDEERKKKEALRRAAFRSYLKNGLRADEHGFTGVSEEHRQVLMEMRDMGSGGGNALQGTGGGYFVPVGFVQEVEEALKYYGDMLNVATIMDTATGQPLPHPTDNDTTVQGELIGEGAQVTTADVTIGSVIFGAWKYSTKMVKVSIELLQDSAFDIESYLKQKFAIRLGRILNNHFTVGTGTGQPNGIITASTSGFTATGSSTNDGGSGTGDNSIGSDDLVELEHSVDRLYRRGAKYMLHDLTLKTIKKVKDKYGRPLWLPGLSVKEPDTILSYPYSVNNDMDQQTGSSKKIVAFGALDKYVVRHVKELAVLRLTERFADYGQVAFIGFARYDGQLLDAGTHPVKYLVTP